MRLYLVVILLMVCAGCDDRPKQATNVSEQGETNGVHIRAKFIQGGFVSQGSAEKMAVRQSGEADTNYLYFDIQMERPGFEADKKTAEYMDFGIEADFSMINGSDSIPAALVHRVANGRKDVYEYIVVFSKVSMEKNEKGNVEIVYDDKIFGLGRHVFQFRKQDLLKATDKTN